MFVFKALTIIFFQAYVLVNKGAAKIKNMEELVGRSEDKHCDCGISHFKPDDTHRLGEEKDTNWKKYPWMVGLVQDGKIVCGGSLIDTQYVLTAAHCLRMSKGIRMALNVRHTSKRMATVAIASIFIHPIYDEKLGIHKNDIAVVRLEKPIFYTKWVRPICLGVNPKMYRVGTTVKVIGFGQTSPGGNMSTFLREVSIPIKNIADCRESLDSVVLQTAICAGGIKDQDACEGDSGGPMFYTDSNGRSFQVGIVSWGESCGKEGVPSVYTRVSPFLHWVRNLTTDSPSCEKLFPPLIGPNVQDCGIPEKKCKGNNTYCDNPEYIFNWMARIFYKNKYLGNGVLANRTYVITTTNVISPWHKFKNARDLRIVIGGKQESVDTGKQGVDTGKQEGVSTNVLEFQVSYADFHLLQKQVPVVILKLSYNDDSLTVLHRPLCMPDPNVKRDRTGEKVTLMFWQEKGGKNLKTKTKNRSKKHNYKKMKKMKRKRNHVKSPKKKTQQKHFQRKNMELKIKEVKIVNEKRCKFPKNLKERGICGIIMGKKKCHENGAVLMKYVAGRFYMLGFVAPTTKKCSRVKEFLKIAWNFNWLHYTQANITYNVE